MIDHLLSFADEAAAQAALPTYWAPASDDDPGSWRGDYCIPNSGAPTLEVYSLDSSGNKVPYPGWHIVISLPALNPALRDLSGNACRLITDREAAERGEAFILYTAPDLDPAILSAAHVEPLFAGATYPFGGAG